MNGILCFVANIRWDRPRAVDHRGYWQSDSFTLSYTASASWDNLPDSVARSFGF